MPGWNIHLEAGERLAKKLKFSDQKRKEFLLGCLLPDINNGYINQVKTKKEHSETHYAFDQKSSLNFYAENKTEIDQKNPIFLGYLFHLYTDGFFNYDFYRTIKRDPLGDGLDHIEKRKIKHHDFRLYDMKYHHHLDIENREESERLAALANQINIPEITPEDIEDVERILMSDALRNYVEDEEYLFYTEERLDNLLEDMIESFSNDYLGAPYA